MTIGNILTSGIKPEPNILSVGEPALDNIYSFTRSAIHNNQLLAEPKIQVAICGVIQSGLATKQLGLVFHFLATAQKAITPEFLNSASSSTLKFIGYLQQTFLSITQMLQTNYVQQGNALCAAAREAKALPVSLAIVTANLDCLSQSFAASFFGAGDPELQKGLVQAQKQLAKQITATTAGILGHHLNAIRLSHLFASCNPRNIQAAGTAYNGLRLLDNTLSQFPSDAVSPHLVNRVHTALFASHAKISSMLRARS